MFIAINQEFLITFKPCLNQVLKSQLSFLYQYPGLFNKLLCQVERDGSWGIEPGINTLSRRGLYGFGVASVPDI